MTQDYNITDQTIPDLTDGNDEDMNKFEQEIQRDQPSRANRRHVSRIWELLNEGEKIDKPLTADR